MSQETCKLDNLVVSYWAICNFVSIIGTYR